MAIKKQITFEGLIYNLDDKDRVAAQTALDLKGNISNQLFVSPTLQNPNITGSGTTGTAAAGTSNNTLANTSFVSTEISAAKTA